MSALRLAAAGLALLVLASGCAPRRPRDVVLIVVDTLRADQLGCYGSARATSPNVDRLAADAVRFERAYSQAPWTTPSIGSLLTSRYPTSLGIQRVASPLPADALRLPEVLRDAGWATGGVVSHTFCSARWGFARGFQSFDESNIAGQLTATSEGVTDRALEFVARNAGRPFFLFVHYFDPHFALLEHEGFRFPRSEPYVGRVHPPVLFLQWGRRDAAVSPADAREMLRIYDSEVAFTDHHIGRLLDDLRARGLYDDSLIVLTADHGEEFLEHGGIGHTKTLYGELLHVPLLVKLPGGGGRVEPRPVGLVDVFPTILDVLGLARPPQLVGRSLLEEPDEPRPVFAETARQANLAAVLLGDWKLVLDVGRRRSALYHLSDDPGEHVNLARRDPARAAGLGALLSGWRATAEPHHPLPRPLDLSDEERARLRELGYAE